MSAGTRIVRGLVLVAWELVKFPFVLLRVLSPAILFGSRLFIAASAWFYEGDFEPAYALVALAFALVLHAYAHRSVRSVGALASCIDCVVAGVLLGLLGAWGVFPNFAPAVAAWALSGALFYAMSGAAASATQGDSVAAWHKLRKLDSLRPKEVARPQKDMPEKGSEESSK